jgi:spermidine/putrescine transport system permease protein
MEGKRNRAFYFVLLPVLAWLLILIFVPHIELLVNSFKVDGQEEWTLQNYTDFFTNRIYWLTFLRTVGYAIGVTVLAFVVAFPVAFYLTKVVSKRYVGPLTMLLLVPLWVGELITIYGWMIILGDHGIINAFLQSIGLIDKPLPLLYNDFSMILGLLYMSVLFMIVPIMSTLESLDDALIEAASDLGAGKWTIIRRIVIPYSMPGIVSGSIIVFMLVIGDYLAPNILGGKSSLWFTEQIYNQFLSTFNWNEGAAFGFLLLLISSFIVWVALKASGQKLERVGS